MLGLTPGQELSGPGASANNWVLRAMFLRDILLYQKFINLRVQEATADTPGVAQIADEDEGRSGTNNNRIMTSERLLDQLREGVDVNATTLYKGTALLAILQDVLDGNGADTLITPDTMRQKITQELEDYWTPWQLQEYIRNSLGGQFRPVWGHVPNYMPQYNDILTLNLRPLLSGYLPFTIEASGLPSGFSIDNYGIIRGNAINVGAHTITLTAENLYGESNTTFTITVTVAAPTWSAVPNRTLSYNGSISLNLNNYVSSQSPVTITATGLPTGIVLNNGILSGRSTRSGSHTLTLTATNSGGSRQTTFRISIAAQVVTPDPDPEPTIRAPVWSSSTPNLINLIPTIGSTFNVGRYVLNSPTSFSWTFRQPQITLDNNGIVRNVLLTGNIAGSYGTVTITATNSVGSASRDFTLTYGN